MQHGNARAFTLVELLMVIALIALLAAILFPSLKAAKQAGQRTQCTGNLRQLHVAAVSFAADNSGWLPYARMNQPNETTSGGWGYQGYQLWQVGNWYSVTHEGTNGVYELDSRAPMGSTLAPYFGKNPLKPGPNPYSSITGFGPDGAYNPGGIAWWDGVAPFPSTMVKNILTCPGVTGRNREYWPSYGLNPFITSTRTTGANNNWPFHCDAGGTNGWPHDFTRQQLNSLRTPANLYLFGDSLSGAEVVTLGSVFNEWHRIPYGTYEPHNAGNWGGWNFYEVRSSGRARHGDRRVRVYADGHAEVYREPAYFKVCGACLDPTSWIDQAEGDPPGTTCN